MPNSGSVSKFLTTLKALTGRRFNNSENYWVNRYASGQNSGSGSYGRLAEFKAKILNEFVASNGIQSVIEYGVGDGNQLSLAKYPRYMGFDISPVAVELCKTQFAGDETKSFCLVAEFSQQRSDLTLSVDVIYHLVEDSVFDLYMHRLFDSGDRYVAIYASNTDNNSLFSVPHVRMRKFSDWIETNKPSWKLDSKICNPFPYDSKDPGNTSFADFYFYKKTL